MHKIYFHFFKNTVFFPFSPSFFAENIYFSHKNDMIMKDNETKLSKENQSWENQ